MAYKREFNVLRFKLLQKGRTRWQLGKLMSTANSGTTYKRCTIGRMREAWLEWSEETRTYCEQIARTR